jgi:hypothetical protein
MSVRRRKVRRRPLAAIAPGVVDAWVAVEATGARHADDPNDELLTLLATGHDYFYQFRDDEIEAAWSATETHSWRVGFGTGPAHDPGVGGNLSISNCVVGASAARR